MAVHGGSGVSYGVIELLRMQRPEARFLELVHRLDRDTSGVLLIAKKRHILVTLHALLRRRDVDKRYLALTVGEMRNERQHVRLPLHTRLTAMGERRTTVDSVLGKPAHTVFNRLDTAETASGRYSMVEAELKTGRTHQIRVHLARIGYSNSG